MRQTRFKNIVIFGANGAIGSALLSHFSETEDSAVITTVSRNQLDIRHRNHHHIELDVSDKHAFDKAMPAITKCGPYDLVIVTTGTLHSDSYFPEKSLSQLTQSALESVYHTNTIVPALIMQRMVPLLDKNVPAVFAALSARVGSISDNRLGGWYAYRASKAALNMLIKTAAIETARRNKRAAIVGLHPGTVASALSKPFLKNVPDLKRFTPSQSATYLAAVLEGLNSNNTGKVLAWDGSEIPA